MNRFAHLKQPEEPQEAEGTPEAEAPGANSPETASATAAPAPVTPEVVPDDDLQEYGHLVERKVGILGKIPASLKDSYDEMLLRARKYVGRPNSDLAVQAWVELTLEDEAVRRRWLKRIQDLRKG